MQADEAAFKEQIASPDGELTGEAYDALLAVHLAQRQSHAVDRAALVAMSESARLKVRVRARVRVRVRVRDRDRDRDRVRVSVRDRAAPRRRAPSVAAARRRCARLWRP